jgi:hypothetical protein
VLVDANDFWKNVDKAGACWPWLAGCRKGYPVYRGQLAMRLAWTLTHGPIPEGRHVRRRCSSRLCLNPAHLTVDAAEHVRRPIHKLSRLMAEDVRARHANGESVIDLAKRHDITPQHVRGILRKRVWQGDGRTPTRQPGSIPIVEVVTDADGVDWDVLACGHVLASTPWPNKWRRCKQCLGAGKAA